MQTIYYTDQTGAAHKAEFPTKAEAADWLFDQDQITIVKMTETTAPAKFVPATNPNLQAYGLTDDYGYRGTIAMTPLFATDYRRKHPTHTLELLGAAS